MKNSFCPEENKNIPDKEFSYIQLNLYINIKSILQIIKKFFIKFINK